MAPPWVQQATVVTVDSVAIDPGAMTPDEATAVVMLTVVGMRGV
jgi:hypothetical protein